MSGWNTQKEAMTGIGVTKKLASGYVTDILQSLKYYRDYGNS